VPRPGGAWWIKISRTPSQRPRGGATGASPVTRTRFQPPWRKHHQWRHRLSVHAYRWLTRKRLLRRPAGEAYRVAERRLRLGQLPAELDGLRIAHLSDLHVGHLITPAHLPAIIDAVNDTDADLIVNTGDLLDHSNTFLSAAIEAMAGLDAPLGVYHVLGNHDHRDGVDEVIAAFGDAGLNLLMNEQRTIEAGRQRITMAGIDFAEGDQLQPLVEHACAGMEPAGLKILLAHHPHAFDFAVERGVDLVLSGHTHGGQFVFRSDRIHGRNSFGLGNLKWRYPQGHYVRGLTHLYVTNGLGGSFPVRFRCPAEINVIQLRRA